MIPLDIQWFIKVLVTNDLMTLENALDVYHKNGSPALEAFAQAILDTLASAQESIDVNDLLEQIQQVADFAIAKAECGEDPELLPSEAAPADDGPADPFPQTAGACVEHDASGKAILAFKAPAPPPFGGKAPAPPPFGGGVSASMPHADTTAANPPGDPVGESDSELPPVNSSAIPKTLEMGEIITFDGCPDFDKIKSLDEAGVRKFVNDLLLSLRSIGASDLHFSSASPPFIRRNLKLERISTHVLMPEESQKLNYALLSEDLRKKFEKEKDFSFALEVGTDRFRVALMVQKDGISGSYRLVPDKIQSLSDLGFLPQTVPVIERMLDYTNGLVLVTGPIGSGKTTTLAAMVNIINEKRQDHVISVEDPIEIVQHSHNCQITQREIGKHTDSYKAALKGALREDPDIIVVGELFDLETIENAITASETGHLVIGTLPTSDAANTLNRLLDVFPPSQQAQIRAMTAGSLRGVICQRLLPAADGGVTIGYELMTNSMSISNLINEGKTFQLKASMQIGQKLGMITFDQCLLEKFKLGILTYEVAKSYMKDTSIIGQLDRLQAIEEAKKLSAEG